MLGRQRWRPRGLDPAAGFIVGENRGVGILVRHDLERSRWKAGKGGV